MAASGSSRFARPVAFTYPAFTLYQVARFCIVLATEMQSVAVGWQVYEITKRPLDLGLVGLAQFLPGILLFLVSGHTADRYDRRRVLTLGYARIRHMLGTAARDHGFPAAHGLSHLRGRRVGWRGAFLQCPCKPRDPASAGAGRTFSQRVRLGRHDFPDRYDFGTGARRACLCTLSRAGNRLRRGHGGCGGCGFFDVWREATKPAPAARSLQLENGSRRHALHLA